MQQPSDSIPLWEFYLRLTILFVVAIFASIVFFVVSIVLWRNPGMMAKSAKIICPLLCKVLGIRVVLEGFEKLNWKDPYLMVGNHQSNFDYITYGCIAYPRAVTVGKKELLYIPFFGLFYYAAGNIIIDRKKSSHAIQKLSQAVERIHTKKSSIFIFPEGTRNKTGEYTLLPFKKGAFHMAIQAQVPLTIFVSSPVKKVFSWKERHLQRGGVIRIRCSDVIETRGMTSSDLSSLSDLVRSKMLQTMEELK